jgi:hypothetical protein
VDTNGTTDENEGKLFLELLRSFLDAVQISEKNISALFMKKADALSRVPVLIIVEANGVLGERKGRVPMQQPHFSNTLGGAQCNNHNNHISQIPW